MSKPQSIALAAFVSLALATAGCGSAGSEAVGEDGSCAFTVNYRGHTYIGSGVGVAPLEGKPLGRATLPACNDTGEAVDAEPAEEIELAEVDGVSPSVAVAWRGYPDTVLIREDVDYDRLPPALARLLRAPKCDRGDEPFQLAGPWLGIIGADGQDRARPGAAIRP